MCCCCCCVYNVPISKFRSHYTHESSFNDKYLFNICLGRGRDTKYAPQVRFIALSLKFFLDAAIVAQQPKLNRKSIHLLFRCFIEHMTKDTHRQKLVKKVNISSIKIKVSFWKIIVMYSWCDRNWVLDNVPMFRLLHCSLELHLQYARHSFTFVDHMHRLSIDFFSSVQSFNLLTFFLLQPIVVIALLWKSSVYFEFVWSCRGFRNTLDAY